MEQCGDSPDVGDIRFTDTACLLLTAARSESDRLRHDYVGTEHLVLALARPPDDTALLSRLGLDGGKVRRLLEETIVPGRKAPAPGVELPYTSRTKKTFSLAADSARTAGHAAVGPEHILLGLLLEGRYVGAEILQRCGLTIEQAAAQVSGPKAAGGQGEENGTHFVCGRQHGIGLRSSLAVYHLFLHGHPP